MTSSDAKQLLELLARGVDPMSGEVLATDHVVNHPNIVRALYMAVLALGPAGSEPAPRPRAPRPGNAGASWNKAAELELVQAFDEGASVKDLASRFGRTTGAIRARLMKLGRLQDAAE